MLYGGGAKSGLGLKPRLDNSAFVKQVPGRLFKQTAAADEVSSFLCLCIKYHVEEKKTTTKDYLFHPVHQRPHVDCLPVARVSFAFHSGIAYAEYRKMYVLL